MKLSLTPGRISYSRGSIPVAYKVLDAREIGDIIVAIFDHMAFPQGEPARNLFAYSSDTGGLLWRAEDIGMGGADAYTDFISEEPLTVGNFAGADCRIDAKTGQVIFRKFTK